MGNLKELLNFVKGNKDEHYQEEIFPNEFLEDNFIIRPDGNLAVGFELKFPERESLASEEIKPFMESLTNILEQLPTGTAVHFQSQYYYRQSNVQALNKMKLGFLSGKLAEHHRDKPVLNNKVILYIIFNFQNRKTPNPVSHFLASFNFWPKNHLANLSRDKSFARNAVQALLKNLESLKNVKVRQLDTKSLESEQLKYYNLQFDGDPRFFSNNIHNRGFDVKVGNKFVSFVYLQRTGKCLYDYQLNNRNVPTFMAWPLGFNLNFPHVVNLAFIIDDRDRVMDKLETKKNISQSLGASQNVNDRSIALEIDVFLQQMRESGRKLVYCNHNVMVWDTNPDTLSVQLDQVKSAYLTMNGSIGATDSFGTGNYFFTFSPGYALDLFHTLTLSIDDAINHFDFSSPHISDQKGIIFSNREGEPILVDLWHPDLDSFNRIVIGPSGSGKSFTLAYILSQEIDQGIEVIIIDVGGSYKNLLDFHPSKYYEYKNDIPLSFNPFLIPKKATGYDLSKEKVVFLTALITVLWKRTDNGERLSREEQSVLTNLLESYYNFVNKTHGHIPRLDRFLAFIEEYKTTPGYTKTNVDEFKYFAMDSFLLVLRTFTEGIYKDILNSDETESIGDYKLICFDLNGIQKDPVLYPIVALLIMELVLDKVRNSPTVRKEIVIDEAWSMLTGALAEFIEMLYRTVRKAGGAVTIVSQDITPIERSAIGEAVRGNAPTKILLDHRSQTSMLSKLQSFFALTEHNMQQLLSIRNEGNRRELMLIRGDKANNLFVDAGTHLSLAFSSWATDRSRIQDLKGKVGIESAINQYTEEKLNIPQS
jgi:conjugation system TraG family ATPase